MKPHELKTRIDKMTYGLARFEETNFRGEKPLASQYRSDLKSFAVLALEGMLEEIEQYGKNTHTYAVANAFLSEFRNEL